MKAEHCIRMAAKLEHKKPQMNELIFMEGDLGDSFFIVFSGQVEVVNGGAVVATLGAGQSFGEMACIPPPLC